jgi:choline dehydrogenase-like flavoprotein
MPVRNKFRVDAKIFILATGGIENARLLLVSNKVQKHGLGNHYDVVGRYFMDHPLVNCGLLTPYDKTVFNRMALYDKQFVNNETVMGKFVLTEAVMRKEKLFNMSALVFPREETYKSPGKMSARTLLRGLRRGTLPEGSAQHLKKFILHVDEVAIDFYKLKVKKEMIYPSLRFGGWGNQKGNEKKYSKFEVISQTEETPSPRNRVTLSETLDKLGSQQAKLVHYWSPTDIENVRRSQKVFADEFARAGLGQMQFEWEDDRPIAIPSSHHHLGTTRMHESAKEGVVDANCKVHGLSNLFVAGSSVFATGGYANPTLTLIALAVRLADHLKASFSQKVFD